MFTSSAVQHHSNLILARADAESVLKIEQGVGMNLRLFLWIAALFAESAAIYSVALLARLHHWV
jgi:hypothetical protein